MMVLSDAKGVALIFEDEAVLDKTIERLRVLRDFKREKPEQYPAVFTYTHEGLPAHHASQLHDQAWWMGFAVQGKKQPGGSRPAEDS